MARPEEGYPAATETVGSGYLASRAYRWYEPIKILPPRTRRRPYPTFDWEDFEQQLRAKGWSPDPARQAYIIRNHVLDR